jgi:type III restriction enzyme
VQGWRRSRIYADFIFTALGSAEEETDYRKVFVLETKGLHLKNENTDYKRSVFAVCNEHAKRKTWNELAPTMRDKEITYEIVFQDEWEKRLIRLLAD